MNSLQRNDKRYFGRTQDSEKPSKVLLVCVYDTVVFQLANDIIYNKFQKFGTILKLLIFEKGQVTKFFIEFQNIEQAIGAKNALDGTKLCQTICKMTIYFSNFTNVDLKHQTTQGVDYIIQEQGKQNFIQKFDMLTKGSQKQDRRSNQQFHQQLIMTSFSSFTSFNRSKTEDPRLLQNHIKKIQMVQEKSEDQQIQIQSQIKKGIDNILDTVMQAQAPYISRQKIPKIKEQTQIKSSILSFKYKYDLKLKNVYNLFSNFGNISWIINQQNQIYIKFRSVQFAAIAKTYLNNTIFFGNLLFLENSTIQQEEIAPKQGEYYESIYYDASYDRFTSQRSLTINPPSQTLHVSSIKREICKEQTLKKIFSDYGSVERVHILHQSNEKNMALVKFYCIEDSFQAISELHNKLFMGRKMQISFTKSKL